jgi:hypothetical protein
MNALSPRKRASITWPVPCPPKWRNILSLQTRSPAIFRLPILRRSNADPAAFAVFLQRQAAFIAQKTVIDYCRVKSGRYERQVFADLDFQAALRHCRWQVYLGSLADMGALAEAWLRPHVPGREAQLADALVALYARALADEPPPPEEARSARHAADAFPRHLAALQRNPPVPAQKMPLLADAPLLATIPVHPDQRIGETPAIRGALRFHVVSAQQEMERRFDPAQIAKRLMT